MKKIDSYWIASGASVKDLIFSVNAAIKAGWQPFGNLAMNIDQHGEAWYAQPMVKYEAERPVNTGPK